MTIEDYLPQSGAGHNLVKGEEEKAGKAVHIQQNYYDAENLRYGIEEDGERTNFVTNGWSVITELDGEWKPTKRLVRGYGIVASEELGEGFEKETQPFSNQKVEERYHFYHPNEHGDVEYITGRDGKVKNAYTYDAFGNITNAEELVKNRYTYNGEQYDQLTQQYYLRARNYNPLIGRFTQEDVYRGDGLNLYAYCGNNPVMYVDPSGYTKKCGMDSESGSNSDNYVYRALNQKDYERYTNGLGLEAKNPNGNWSLNEHLVNGSGKASWANDPYISTTSDLSVAKGFNQSGSGYGIVKIDMNKVTSASYKGYEIYPRVNGVEGLPYHYSVWQQETSVYQSIPFEAIVGYFN